MPDIFIRQPIVAANYVVVLSHNLKHLPCLHAQSNCCQKRIQSGFSVSFDRLIISFQISVFSALRKTRQRFFVSL